MHLFYVFCQVCLNETLFRREDSIAWDGSELTSTAVSMDFSLPKARWGGYGSRNSLGGQCREGINTLFKASSLRFLIFYHECGCGCDLTGELFHFQGWKKGAFFQFHTRAPSHDTHALLVTQHGFIPLRLDFPHTPAPGSALGLRGVVGRDDDHTPVPSLQHLLQQHYHYHQLSEVSYTNFESFHCKQFKNNLKACLSPIWPRDVEVLAFEAPPRKPSAVPCSNQPSLATLIVATSALGDVFSGVLKDTLMSFEGDQVETLSLNGIITNIINY
jgi:hypothetical protein